MSNFARGTKAIIYARVSSREQADEGYSIDSQLKLLRGYANEHGLDIIKSFTDVESAKAQGRTQFTAMKQFLKSNRSVRTVLCEKTDRLYRNFHDYTAVDVDQSDLTIVLVKEGVVLSRDSRSHEKLAHGFKVLIAKHYIDNLREETSKGLQEKAEQGEAPQLAPIGYKNDTVKHIFVMDPEKAPHIRRMFELYSTGNISLNALRLRITDAGLRTKKGRKLHTSQIAFLLANPVYYGAFRRKGKVYPGTHPPIVSKALFDAAQTAAKRFNKTRYKTKKNNFAFRGLLRCGKCGCNYTAERVKKRYVYYRCSSAKGRCKNSYLREEEVDRLLERTIKEIQIDERVLKLLTEGLKDSHGKEKAYHDKAVASLHQTYRRLQDKLDKAYSDKLDGAISEEFWERQSEAWRKEQEEVRASVERHEKANKSYFKLGVELLELAHQACELYRVRNYVQKRRLVDFVVSNLVVDGNNVTPIYKEPFGLLAKGLCCPKVLRRSNGLQNRFGGNCSRRFLSAQFPPVLGAQVGVV